MLDAAWMAEVLPKKDAAKRSAWLSTLHAKGLHAKAALAGLDARAWKTLELPLAVSGAIRRWVGRTGPQSSGAGAGWGGGGARARQEAPPASTSAHSTGEDDAFWEDDDTASATTRVVKTMEDTVCSFTIGCLLCNLWSSHLIET